MENIKIEFCYIISFESIDVIGGIRQIQLSRKCYSILGIQYQNSIIDIKTKRMYPILIEENIDSYIDVNMEKHYACIDQAFLNKVGIFSLPRIEPEDQAFLHEKIEDTYQYIEQLKQGEEQKRIVPYQKFLKRRLNYKKR